MTADEMQARDAASAQPVAPAPAPTWSGSWIELGVEQELVSPNKAMIRGTKLQMAIHTTGWSSFDTPSGESRSGWADLRFIQDGEVKSVRIDEGDFGFAFGYRIDVLYAYELWDDDRAVYDPHVKFIIARKK